MKKTKLKKLVRHWVKKEIDARMPTTDSVSAALANEPSPFRNPNTNAASGMGVKDSPPHDTEADMNG